MVIQTHAIEIESATASFEALRRRALAPLSTVTPREFAESVMKMPDAHGATRPFTFGYAPYQLAPYLAIFDPRNIEVVMMMASRLGKSRVVLTALGFVIVEQPCRIGVMWPVEGDGKLWSKDDLMGELVEPTPEIARLIDDARGQRKTKNSLLQKRFPGGLLQILGANAPGRLRRMKARFLYADEIDGIETTSIETKEGRKGKSEGDILDIFAKRGSEYADCSQVYCSYPSLRGRSRIEAKLLETDLQQWFVTCPLCGGEPFIMHRTGLDPFGDGRKRSKLLYDPDRPQDARLECPNCKGHLDDHQRYAMMMGGDPQNPRYDLWQPTRPYRGKTGFHANSLLMPHKYGDPAYLAKYPGGYLQEIAEKEMKIERSENPEAARMVFVNVEDSETYQRECDAKPEHSKLFLRREKYEPAKMLPAGVLWVCITWDIQADRAEGEMVGFGERGQTWGLGYHVIKGTPMCEPTKGIWAEMDRIFLTTTFAHPSGKTLRISGELVDRGFKPDYVLAYTRTRARRGTFASRGATSLSKPIVRQKAGWEGNPKAKVWEIGTHEAKDIIYQRLERDNKAADGYMHYPELGCYSEQYFKMLVAEDSDMQKASDGKFYRCFHCDQGVRNEALDIRVMALAIERIRKPNYKKLAIELAVEDPGAMPGKSETKPAEDGPKKPVSPVKTARPFIAAKMPRSGGFVGGWRR